MILISYTALLYSTEEDVIIDTNLKQWYDKNIAYIKTYLFHLMEEHSIDIITFSKENTKLSLVLFMPFLGTSSGTLIARQIS